MSNLSATSVAGLILTLLGFIVGIVAMATDHWADVIKYEDATGFKIEVLHFIQALFFGNFGKVER